MVSILSLPASLRITMFFFEMIVSAILLFIIVYGILGKRKKLYLFYVISLFVSLIVIIITRTPVLFGQNKTVSLCLNFILLAPAVLAVIIFIKTKDVKYLLDSILCVFNIPIFEFIPYYAYIVSGLFVYVIVRAVLSIFENIESVKKYPGRLAIKSALDGLNDGIAFVNSFGQITYINKSLKTTLQTLEISSHRKATFIVESIKVKTQESGRKVSNNTYILNLENKAYKFSFNNPLSQISCIDVNQEEKLLKQSEENKISLEKANVELNANTEKIDQIQREQELLTIKGHIHDNLAQQLSILHMFILNDNSKDLTQIKEMLSNLEITKNEDFDEDYTNNLAKLLNMIGVELSIKGKIPAQNQLKAFIHKIIKETSTNAIRHGKATKIDVEIVDRKNNIEINISNNGAIPEKIVYGNGLNNIKAELGKFGGKMTIQTKNTFAINILINKVKY